MSLLIFIHAAKFIRRHGKVFSLLIVLLAPQMGQAEWTVDFSRRQSQMQRTPASTTVRSEASTLGSLFQNVAPTQEIVILNTEQGFIPATVRVREGLQYKFIVVNVNEKAKNVSFIMDAFSEHHATFYGKLKSFFVVPKKAGVYSFVSPETSAQGRLVVQGSSAGEPAVAPVAPIMSTEVRTPASIQSVDLPE